MQIAVRYFSRGGNIRKLAEAMAAALGVEALDITHPLPEPVDLLFIGGAAYAFGIDTKLEQYIELLTPTYVDAACVFCSHAVTSHIAPEAIRRLLEERGIEVLSKAFICPGEFTLAHRGRPNDADLRMAAEFAQEVVRLQTQKGR